MYLLTLKNRKTEGAYAVQDAKGDKVLFLFEDEDELCNFETGVDGDFMIDMGEIGDSKMHILEFKLRRWGQKAIGKIKCIFDKGEWEVSRLPLKYFCARPIKIMNSSGTPSPVSFTDVGIKAIVF